MTKQNLILKLFFPIVVVASILGISCKKYIYQGPITSTYGAEFWTSQQSVEQATAAMYGQLRADFVTADNSSPGLFFLAGDYVSGSFFNASRQDYRPLTASRNPFGTGPFNFNYAPYNHGMHDWSRFYQLIAQCNLILQNVPDMPTSLFGSENKKNAYLGEALFMKSFTYFYIIRIWGDPVFVEKTYNGADYGNIAPIARSPEADVLDSCISYLTKATSYLEYTAGDPSKSIRANKGSALALLAHIYAWKHDYANAHKTCLELINNGGYSLEPMSSYKNIWAGEFSSESIFEISMLFNPTDPNFKGQGAWAEARFDFFATFLKGPIINNLRSQSWVSPYDFIQNLYDTTNDARFKTILSFVPPSGSDEIGYMLEKYTNFKYAEPGTETSPYINNNLVVFRLSDIILLDAEALASTGDLAGAAADLAQTENRAGISSYSNPTNQFEMLNEIIDERGRELIGEGQWYFDLIRTEPAIGRLVLYGYPRDRVTPANKGYYWPLDMPLLFPQDNLLTQNPWWASHTL
ncbi:RagB/SusD family nutrient uptake outer membrane protein [Ginsengibacter hankyongi]|uniref:RagB/SusD family nutrient uptake outer membrane protein n=1 Tax=Ginsengibacter hankyongi TaxID=2607284 RepID=A0A5J5IE15_9BACT|nr:RagB/SusD family nutrient uptake outer membrane protein [Ginsengibacter hankyongi]KAA9037761.1 RagB/SusD family nutrient uptake outer membrane protein [Ginsengibacter hankyongi]